MKNGSGKDKTPLDFEDGGEEKEGTSSSGNTLGLCFGCALGLLVQVVTGEVMWLPMGVAVGYGLGFAIGTAGKKKK